MFEKVAWINFIQSDHQETSIICHMYKSVKLGDAFIQVYQNKIYVYTVRQICGYKQANCQVAEEGENYKINVEVPTQADLKVFENLKYGDYLFGICDTFDKKFYYDSADFRLAGKKQQEQFYKMVFYCKNYKVCQKKELQKIVSYVNALQKNYNGFCYDAKGIYINDIMEYVENAIKNNEDVIHIYDRQDVFSLYARIGNENSCVMNRIEILLPEKCVFCDDIVNDELLLLFQKMNTIINPFWSYIGNSKNLERFPNYVGGNLPVSVHHINYYCIRLVDIMKRLFQVNLPEYFVCRKYPFNDYVQSDLELQKHYYQKYKFDKMSNYLQKIVFYSEKELLEYCEMLQC